MSAAVSVTLSLVFLATIPLAAYLEKSKGSPKMWRILRIAAVLLGAVGVTVTSVCFSGVTKNHSPETAAWARDFYFGYLKTFLTGFLMVLVLLSLARLIDHPMRRTVSVLEVLLPVAVLLCTVFISSMASGDIAVDRFICAVVPSTVLMSHLPGVFRKKCEKNRKNPRTGR